MIFMFRMLCFYGLMLSVGEACLWAQIPRIAQTIRLEETIAANDKTNEPFFRQAEYADALNHSVTLVVEGIQKGQLRPYTLIGPDRSAKMLSYDEWLAGMQENRFDLKPWQKSSSYKADVDPQKSDLCVYNGQTYQCVKTHSDKRPDIHIGTYWQKVKGGLLHPHAIALIKLDLTRNIPVEGSLVERVNYITFCDEPRFALKGLIVPRFSIKWNDFIRFLEKYHSDKLYYVNGFGPWFKDQVFITHNYYWQDYFGLSPLNFIPKVPLTLENITTNEKINAASLRDLYAKEGEGQIAFEKQGGISNILLRVKVPNKQLETYRLSWSAYEKALQDSNRVGMAKAVRLADAWKSKRFAYDESMKLVYGGDAEQAMVESTISKNGFFIKSGKKDPLSKGRIASSFSTQEPKPINAYTYTLEEEISLRDTLNSLLWAAKQPLQSLVREYVLSGKLPSIRCYDTVYHVLHSFDKAVKLKQYYTIKELKRLLVKEYLAYHIKDTYRAGDVVSHAGAYYKALKNPEGVEPTDSSALLEKVWLKVKPEIYDAEQLWLLKTHHQRIYDPTMSVNKYVLDYVEFVLPESENLKGIDKPILVVSWPQLKKLLQADARASFTHKGAKANYADIMEKRQYQSWLLKTGFLRAMK